MSVTIEVINSVMEQRKRPLAFPAALERQFEIDTYEQRCKRLRVGVLVSAVLYNFFLIADWFLVPDMFRVATLMHLGLVTPWMLFAALVMGKCRRAFVRECLAASVPLLITLQIEISFALTTSDTAAHYQYVIIPTLLYANVSLHRLPFFFARAVTAVIVVLHTTVILSVDYVSGPVAIIAVSQIVVSAYITLVANFTMERDLRRSYLFSLRDRLRHSQADAASRRDALTGLANRRHLDIELDRLWASNANPYDIVSVILMDIDHFKRLNDQYGHGTGDQCLKRMASILTDQLGAAAKDAIRYGGEEFLIVLPGFHLIDAMRTAERIRKLVESSTLVETGPNSRIAVTASFGVASASVSELTATELIAAADSALYMAKDRGRNRVWPPVAMTGNASNGPKEAHQHRANCTPRCPKQTGL